MQELPFNDVYSAGWMSSDTTLWYLQLLPLWLKILNFFVKCLHENIQYFWFICCPRIFDNFDAQKCILKLEWPLSFSLSISDDRINLILVWRLSLIILETSGLAVFHGHSPSKYCCSAVWIQKVFNTFNSKLPWKNSPPSCGFISCKLCAFDNVNWVRLLFVSEFITLSVEWLFYFISRVFLNNLLRKGVGKSLTINMLMSTAHGLWIIDRILACIRWLSWYTKINFWIWRHLKLYNSSNMQAIRKPEEERWDEELQV